MRHSVQLGSRDRARSNSGAAYMDSEKASTCQVAVEGVRMVNKMIMQVKRLRSGQGKVWMKISWHSTKERESQCPCAPHTCSSLPELSRMAALLLSAATVSGLRTSHSS